MKAIANWRRQLRIDTIPVLLPSPDKAIVYFTKRDLLGEEVEPINFVWELPEPQKILHRQQADGSWIKPGTKKEVYPDNFYSLVETFKHFRILIEKYQFTREHPSIQKAAEFLFSFQTPEGDIRGFIGNQYATYYTGYVLSLIIRAGYEDDRRIEKGMRWLFSIRQNDGAWTVPFITHKYDREIWLKLTSTFMEPLMPDRTKPFEHMATDMVLRAFAAHSKYRKSKEARTAGVLLKIRLFQPDAYTSYQSPRYWTRFVFWWPNLLTALDSLSLLGFRKDDPDIYKGLQWFIDSQQPDGLWKLESDKEIKSRDDQERLWLELEICRMLKRYYG